MNTTDPTAASSSAITQASPATIQMAGSGNQQFGHVGTINFFMPPPLLHAAQPPTLAGPRQMRQDQYHLFVSANADFMQSSFIMPLNRALREGTTKPNMDRYAGLENEVLDELCSFPAIFANENRRYADTDEDQIAYFGYVRDIRPYETGVEIHPFLMYKFPQQRLNEVAYQLAIAGNGHLNELNRTHWALKRINITQVLASAGIYVHVPTLPTGGVSG